MPPPATPPLPLTPRVNVADRLAESASRTPDATAVVEAWGKRVGGKGRSVTFAQLDQEADRLARGLVTMGVTPGMRLALLVKPSIEFVTLVFAMLRSGATMVLVDSGLGPKNIVRCLASTNPEGFVALPIGQLLRVVKRRHFPQAKLQVTVGRRWFWGGETLPGLARLGATSQANLPPTAADDRAAIVFTSGSTGPPKGVVYRHETFVTQLTEIERMYDLQAGGVDLACFPLFGLFNVALGITTVLPEMDFSRPAAADPKKLLTAANRFQVTQSFASPAVWDKLSRHCEQTGQRVPTLRKVFSCGAPVPASVLRRTLAFVHPNAEMHTPYGATESLPISTLEAKEVLEETSAKTDEGAGVCVGKKVESITWRVIRITDDPISTLDETEELPTGEIGELIVSGPQVSQEYLNGRTRPAGTAPIDHNANAKIIDGETTDGETIWHRMGDVGYFDDQGRFWYCGRKSHRVVTTEGTLYTECAEGIVNTHPAVRRSALVGVRNVGTGNVSAGSKGPQIATIVVEYEREVLGVNADGELLDLLQANEPTKPIVQLFVHPQLPTDIRHNAKINREELARWAAKKAGKGAVGR